MILMKTKWSGFWEKSGEAPFSSIHKGMEIVRQHRDSCPINAIGLYIDEQHNKNISLLKITKISHNPEEDYDIKIKFNFVKKFAIKSVDFEKEIGSTPLLTTISYESVQKIFRKYETDEELVLVIGPEETILPQKDIKILNDYFYSDLNWTEFEKISALLFHLVGFKIDFKGQNMPYKRVPDFYCYSPLSVKNRICIVVECKNKKKYFISASDERAMKEYILEQKSIVFEHGIPENNVYFLFIAESFSEDNINKITELANETETSGAMITRSNLILLTEKKLRMGYKFYLEYFSKLFKNKEIKSSDISLVYKKENEFKM